MENPHDERQAILLERIVKNSNKCTELVMELNQCLEDIIRANHKVRLASQLAAKYRKNVEYNLKVSGESVPSFTDPSS
jgi:DASH complex subunit DAD4